MTDELPAPLTPHDCDLRGYDFMPLYGHRLFNSDFYYSVSADAFRAGLRLWWAAWQQCPAGSLPDDDTALCRLADMGRDMKGWRALRTEALRGFVRCSDGRLYHPTIAELALEAWARRRKERDRKAAFRNARRGQTADATPDTGGDRDGDNADVSAGHPPGQSSTRARRQDRTGEERKEYTPLPPAPDGTGGADGDGAEGAGTGKRGARPPGWRGQWVGLRATGSNPRAVAEQAKPPPREPSSPLWPALRDRGLSAAECRSWVDPLVLDETGERPTFIAPSEFHAAHVRQHLGPHLAAAIGRSVTVAVARQAADG